MHRTALPALLAALLCALFTAAPSVAAPDCSPIGKPATGEIDQARSASLLFMPGPVRTPDPVMTAQIAQLPGFGVGLFSPTLGRYSPTQMMLDISQGSRVASSLYKPVVAPQPALAADGVGVSANSGRYLQWPGLTRRAEKVPGDLVPGQLGCAVQRAGKRAVWVSPAGASTLTGIAAADAAGAIGQLTFSVSSQLETDLLKAQRYAELAVGTLPPGSQGMQIARALAAADPQRLIVLVQAPPDPARTRLLAIGARGVGGDGGLTSATTRRNGLVVTTDIAPTILGRLGIEPPKDMQGQPIEGASRLSPQQLDEMNARLSLVAGRRAPLGRSVIVLGGLIVILLLLLGRLTGRYAEISRLTQRLVGLAIVWLPLSLLVTAALRPSRASEANIAIAASLLLALLTDRLVRWPRALWVPALAVVMAHGLDFLLLSGQLTGESLLGSNPLYGARFFGVGNELEAVITVSCAMGAGAALTDSRIRRPARWFAGIGVLLALYLGAGRLGADVGGVIFAGAAFGVAALYVAKLRFTPLRVAALILLPLLGLLVIAGLDAMTGGESHLTRTVFEAQGSGDLLKIAERRFSASIEGAKTGGVWVLMLASLIALIWGWIKRERLFDRLTEDGEDPTARRPLRAGFVGALAGTVIGALANDSGPAILIIGTIYIAMGLLYVRGRPIWGTMER